MGAMNNIAASSMPRAASSVSVSASVGSMLRDWRQRRRLSQLDLSVDADISTRHLSFLETGRSAPSREMVLRLAERLDVPLRERNSLLAAAGYASLYPERPLADPSLSAARRAVDMVLKGHEPYPALAIDRHWNMVTANSAVTPLLAGVKEESLLRAPVNVLRLTLHPQGLAPAIVNWAQWRGHLLERVHRQVEASGDAVLVALHEELSAYPQPPMEIGALSGSARGGANDATPASAASISSPDFDGIAVPFQLRTELGVLSFFSTTMTFGTPVDVTLSELAIESFFPADDATAAAFRR
ncbi:helix-turn-helix transcriptional regulator [soil metagenome]